MAFGNVIPIDAEVARQLVRRQTRFRWLVAGMSAAWIAILVPTLVLTPLPPIAPFAALAVLVVLAEHRFILFGDETSMSASIIVVVASIFVFADTSPLAGPVLIASIGGVYLPHLRTRALSKVAFNGTGMGLAAWSAAALAGATRSYPTSGSLTVAAAGTAVLVYWLANNLIVAGHQVTVCGARFIRSARLLVAADTDVLLWTSACCIGIITANGGASTDIAFVACVVALRVATTSTSDHVRRLSVGASVDSNALLFWLGCLALMAEGRAVNTGLIAASFAVTAVMPSRPTHALSVISVGLPLIAMATFDSSIEVISCVLLASILFTERSRSAANAWTYCLTCGASAAAACTKLQLDMFEGPLQSATVAGVLVLGASSALFAMKALRTTSTIGVWTAVGLAVPSKRDAAVVVLGSAFAVGAVHAPLLALGLATAVLACRNVLSASSQRSSVAASH